MAWPHHSFTLSQKLQDVDHAYPVARAFVASLKACTAHKNLETGCELHVEIARMGILENDAFVGSSLVDMYAKCGSLGKAHEVFDDLANRDVVSWTALITGYAEHGHGMEALGYVKQMEGEGILPDSHTFVCSLKACGSIGAIDRGQEMHAQIVKKGLEAELFVGNALVDLYARYGLLESAQDVFSKLLVQDVISWNALITGYVEHTHWEEALYCFEQMLHKGISLNAVSFVCGLKACGIIGAADKGQELHVEIVSKGLEKEILVGNALVDMYAKNGLFEAAEIVFENLCIRDVVGWTALLAGYVEHSRGEKALICFRRMHQEHTFVNLVTYICTLKACSGLGAIAEGKVVHIELAKRGLDIVILVGNSLVDMYAKCGLLETAQKVFDTVPIRDVVLWNALISGYTEHGFYEDALNCLKWMQLDGMALNSVTFICILKACGSIKAIVKGYDLHTGIIKQGFEKELYIGSTLVDMYSKCGLLGEAQNILESFVFLNVAPQNALIAGFSQHKCDEKALHYFKYMQHCGAPMNAATFVCSLKACGSLGALVMGEEIHTTVARRGLEMDLIVGSSLVDMYAKCGLLVEAKKVFTNLLVRDLLSWNALITGDAQVGESSCALDTFLEMTDVNTKPDLVTFVSILNACSHAGLIMDGVMCFDALINVYDLIPTLEHYNCMIDLFCRAGHMDKVVRLINEMPLHPDLIVWHTVLGACQKLGDVVLGRHVLENALLLDNKDVGACVSMVNICVKAFVEEVYKDKAFEL